MTTPPLSRLGRIAQARQQVLHEPTALTSGLLEPWIEQSWQRCLRQGRRPEQRVAFDPVSAAELKRSAERHQPLLQAARPILSQLGRTLADTRYFAILTNQHGVVIDTDGPLDHSDRRVAAITRIGVDLSERSVGTTAIGAALGELHPVWLHRGEHFFNDTSVYSCAGAPLFGPDGQCIGMLDLTGVEAPERPELRHLVARSARHIENALVRQQPHRLLLRLNWPGLLANEEADGLLAIDADGFVTAANPAARQLLPQLGAATATAHHCRDLFALPFEMLFDAARHAPAGLDTPLWSGLRLQVQACAAPGGHAITPAAQPEPAAKLPLRDVETALIQKAVEDARGNVAQAARALGISRATVYRKLPRPPRGSDTPS
jgi:transcriptional regulator of acetoin/glycerol metabolism